MRTSSILLFKMFIVAYCIYFHILTHTVFGKHEQTLSVKLLNFLLYFLQVREATSNDPWGPSSSLMSEIADLTYNVVAFSEIMSMVWKRLNDHGKNWRHVYKVRLTLTSGRCGIWDYKHNLIVFCTPALTQAMTLMEYLIKTGSERVAQQCRENIYAVQTLKDFQFIDRDGKDQVYTNKKLYLYTCAKEVCNLSFNKEIKVELSVLVLKCPSTC